MVQYVKDDLDFILAQILVAEQNATTEDASGNPVAGTPLSQLIPNPLLPWGLRTVDGTNNNIIAGREDWGAADQLFPRLLDPTFRDGDPLPFDPDGPGPLEVGDPTSYSQTSGLVFDSQPRTISNLVVDQTMNNPAAILAALEYNGITGADAQTALAEIQAAFAIFSAALTPATRAQALEALAALVASGNSVAISEAIAAASALSPTTIAEIDQTVAAINAFETSLGDANPNINNDERAVLATAVTEAQQAQAAAISMRDALLAGPPSILDAANALVASTTSVVTQLLDIQVAAQQVNGQNPSEASIQAALDTVQALATQNQLDAAALVGTLDASAPSAELAGSLSASGIEITSNGALIIPNVAPDEGISAPFNSWMTFFGQFFDHGLDLVTKGGGTVFVPLQPDDPLYVPGSPTNFMVLTRATNQPGPDGILGTTDDIHEHTNTTTPFVDQNQTYTSHASHQVFLREYVLDGSGLPVATGMLLEGNNGGLATWADIKAQARDLLGINLTDADVTNVPLLATDEYGRFLRGPNGFAQVVMNDGLGGTILVEGNPLAPLDLTNAVRTGHAFLDDIAHAANPYGDHDGNPSTPNQLLTPDGNGDTGGSLDTPALGEYDDELLNRHFITGDGRGNENIGLTAVHHIFHSEHNRLVEHTKDVVIASGDLEFINNWLIEPITQAELDALTSPDELVWNGERLFQAARFGTEMQYQHLVFEEFARKVNPMVDLFVFNPTMDINPAIFAEFAHVVYRFGHSMLTETVDRLDASGQESDDIGLIQAFLNPVEFDKDGTMTADEAAGAIVRGMTRQTGNEIDEFVTEALRNNLLGLPLDLATINMTRARDAGVPSLNNARAEFYEMTRSEWLKPYTSWTDFAQNLKNPASIINFIAAYGTHASITGVSTYEEKRDAATLLVLGGTGAPADRLDFLNGRGSYAAPADPSLGGLNNVDFWIGGLAEAILPFGGMLGSTFTFVFEMQLENLQNGDRFYYLSRTQGLHFLSELENNAFTKLAMLNTDLGAVDATHLPGEIFARVDHILEMDLAKQLELDPAHDDPVLQALQPKVARDMHLVVDGNTYDSSLVFTGGEHVVLGGSENDDVLIGDLGDDTIWGDGGNDLIIGGHGINRLHGGSGDDIIYGGGDPEFIHGDDGNDVIHGGNGLGDLIFPGDGNDFVIAGIDGKEVFGASGNDFILGTPDVDFLLGGEGDDWIEGGEGFDTIAGENSQLFFNSSVIGHDVMFAGTNEMDFDAESGDDIMVQGESVMRNEGMLGFDWVTFQDHTEFGVTTNMNVKIFTTVFDDILRNRFDRVEALSATAFDDTIIGDSRVSAAGPFNPNLPLNEQSFEGDELTREGVERIKGLHEILGFATVEAMQAAFPNATDAVFARGNILLGNGGSDRIQGEGGDDIIDGDAALQVRIGIVDASGNEIGTAWKMQGAVNFYDATEAAALGVGYAAASPELLAREGSPLDEFMFDRSLNPGQLRIVREVVDGGQLGDVDTAIFRGLQSEYTIVNNADGTWTVTHNVDPLAGGGGAAINDGVDTLRNIEVLQFADGVQILDPNIQNSPATGQLLLVDGTPATPAAVGDTFSVQIGTVDDADGVPNINTFSIAWQFEQTPGAGDWTAVVDPITEIEITGATFTPTPAMELEGLRIRAVATFTGVNNGILEFVTSQASEALAAQATGAPTEGDDILFGTVGDDVINGLGGDDEIFGFAGNDTLIGGPGSDILNGGDGTDTAVFDAPIGQFTFERTPEGTIQVVNNVTLEEDEVISIELFQFTDGLFSLAQIEAFADGITQPPNLVATQGDDILVDTAGQASTIDGLGGSDEIFGLDLNDVLIGGLGDDTLFGGDGDDELNGGPGSDILDGGAGNLDRAVFDGNLADFTIVFAPDGNLEVVNAAGTEEDLLIDIERLQFTDQTITLNQAQNIAGIIRGNGDPNDIDGTAADDVIFGLGGADTLNGLGGDDVLVGGGGADTLNGGAGRDGLSGQAGNDTINGGADDDVIFWNTGDGRDTINGGAGTDTLEINGDATIAETFTIFSRQAAIDAGLNVGGAGTEIVITRTVNGAAPTNPDRIALINNVEEIAVNGRPVAAGVNIELGDTVEVVGDFSATSLALNTITVNGTDGNDVVDISGLTSAHRIVFNSKGGNDTIIGNLRPQDEIRLAAGQSASQFTDTTANGTTTRTFSNGQSITFSAGFAPTFVDGSGASSPSSSSDGFSFTANDVSNLLKLVRGEDVPGAEEPQATGIRALAGTGNNEANPDYGSADQPFIRLTPARYGGYDEATGNLKVNPIFAGLDPRNISNILGDQEAGLSTNSANANIFFMAFGQYFDHGLDFLPKDSAFGTIPIGQPGSGDDPADLTRGALSNASAVSNGATPEHVNKTSPFVDQNQAYGSHELVGQFLRESDGNRGFGAHLLQGASDPSNPQFNMLPTLRELILHHWEADSVFQAENGPVSFRDYYTVTENGIATPLVSADGSINEVMAHALNADFMGTGQTLVGDRNNFIDILDHYVAGDLRANENYTLTSIHTIWARNHNFYVEKLLDAGFDGTTEELFQAAKIANEAEYQKVVFDEFADYLLGGLRGSGHHGHDEYNPNVDARISHEFAAAVYRVGHSLIGQTITVLDDQGQPVSVPLFDAFLNPTNDAEAFGGDAALAQLAQFGYVPKPGFEQIGVNSIIGGIVGQAAEEVDFNLVDAVRNDLVRIRADLFAFNVARGWDVGLGTLNQVRADLLASTDPYIREAIELSGEDLTPYSSWEDFQARNGLSDAVIAQFQQAYPDLVLAPEDVEEFRRINPNVEVDENNTVRGIDRLDLWVGGLAESHINGGMVGTTFWVVLHEQFDRLQEGDRFYYLDRVDGFDFYDKIDELKFSDVVARNTGLSGLDGDIFRARPLDNEDSSDNTAGGDTGDGTTSGEDTADNDDTGSGTGTGSSSNQGSTGTGSGSSNGAGTGTGTGTGSGTGAGTGSGTGAATGSGAGTGTNTGTGSSSGNGSSGNNHCPPQSAGSGSNNGHGHGSPSSGSGGSTTPPSHHGHGSGQSSSAGSSGTGGNVVPPSHTANGSSGSGSGTGSGATSNSSSGATSSAGGAAAALPAAALAGDSANNAIVGDSSSEVLVGNGGDDTLIGGGGDDTFVGGDGNDNVVGGEGSDLIFGNDGNDVVLANGGNDMIYGGSGRDQISAGSGDDLIEGGADRDVVNAGDGDDTVLASVGDGDDAYQGGAGIDTLDMEAIEADITVDLGTAGFASSAQSGFDTISGFENFRGGSGNDTIIASTSVNVLEGGAGSDTYVFNSVEAANGDRIEGFANGDKIDLSAIASSYGFDQGFTVVSGGQLNAAGQITFNVQGSDTVLSGKVSGDAGDPDFSIVIAGRTDIDQNDLV